MENYCTKSLYRIFLHMVKGGILQLVFVTAVAAGTMHTTKAQSVYKVNIDLELNHASLNQIVTRISEKTYFHFAYNVSDMRKVRGRTTRKFKNESVGEILEYLAKTYKVRFRLINETIHIKVEDQPVSEVSVPEIKAVEKVITGIVKDETGGGLPGVSVYIKNTNIGTITDAEGNYKLTAPDEATTLVFSFMGYITEEVLIDNRSVVEMTLYPDISTLSEIVVVGYGTSQRRDLTGAVSSVDMDGKSNNANTNLGQVLQGSVPGVNVGLSPTPGGTPSITIRGKTSLSGSDSPLVVVDGIIFNGSFADLNVNDIQSIDVLKDASAAAVYGSRSANGVLLITTKSGTNEKPQFNLNAYTGFQDMSPTDATKVMNGEQYMTRLVDYAYQSQKLYPWYKTNPTDASSRPVRPDPTDPAVVAGVVHSTEEYDNWLAGKEVNWLDESLRSTAGIQSYDLSVSGKTNNTSYYLSGSHVRQDGIRLGDDFKRSTLRANFSNDITEWLKLGLNVSYSVADYSGIASDLGEALEGSPWANKTNADGSYPIDLAGESNQRHPLSNMKGDDENIRNDLFLVGRAQVKVPWVPGLSYEFNFSNTQVNEHLYQFFPAYTLSGSVTNGYASRQHDETKSILFNNIITYSRVFSELHKVDVTLLGTREKRTFGTSLLEGENFGITSLGYNNIGLATTQYASSSASEENNIAYMARVNYAYKNRYLLTGTLRRDGFSGFAEGNKTAMFKSASIGWVLSEENFMSNFDWLGFLKLRVSYGENGNQDVGRFASIAKATTLFAVFDDDRYVAYRPSTLGNSDLTWETTTSLNLGLDFTVLKDRISGSFDIYEAKTKDVLVNRNLPKATGFNTVLQNIGEIENKGIEIGLNTVNVERNGFKWESTVSFSVNRNKLVRLFGGKNDYDLGNLWFSGKPINVIYGYHNLGTVWTEEEFFKGEVPAGYYPGNFKIEDIVTPDGHSIYNPDDDRKILGYSDPNYRISLNNKLSYKNFTLSFFINSIQGGGGYYKGDPGNLISGGTDNAVRTNRPAIRPYWRPDAPTTNSPGMYYSQPVTGGLYLDKSFIRLQDVSLAYNLPSNVLKKIGVDNFKVYVSGKNLAIWSDWTSWDPEVSTAVPVMRSFVVGVNTSF